jgi:hypothetical protein
VCGLNGRLTAAVEAIDAANAADPSSVVARGEAQPLALAHGRLASEWITTLVPDAPDLWVIAARAHHLRRWELARESYPEGRAGYLRWRRDQKQRHARDIEAMLSPLGFTADEVAVVQALIRRDGLGRDAGAQAIEDAACLAFVETQLVDVAARLDHDHLVSVLQKTAKKMSAAGIAALADAPLGPRERAILADALG